MSHTYLVEIAMPHYLEYWTIKDPGGTPWYFWFDAAGSLVRDTVAPAEDPSGLRLRDISTSPIPDVLVVDDELSTDWYLYPAEDTGELLIQSTNPGGTLEDAGVGKQALSQEHGRYYRLEADSSGVWQVSRQGTAPAEFLRFSFGAKFPIYDGVLWKARVEPAIRSEAVLAQGALIGGRVLPRFGQLNIFIGDTLHDADLAFIYPGVAVRILRGQEDDPFGSFTEILTAKILSTSWTLDVLTLELTNAFPLVDIAIQRNVYLGEGALTGDADLKGHPIPLAYGKPRNISPVLVDHAALVYQVHDGPIDAVEAVYDRAVALPSAGDISDIYQWTPVAGSYVTDLGRGLIRLGAEPDGPVTADIQGDQAVTASDAATILRHIAATRSTLIDPDDMDTAAFTALTAANNAAVSLYLAEPTAPRMATIFDDLMASIGAYWGFTRTLQLTVGQVAIAGTADAVLDADQFLRITRVPPPMARYRIRLGYSRVWTVQPREDTDPVETPAGRKAFIARPYRFAVAESLPTQIQFPTAEVVERLTLLDTETDATAEAQRQLELFRVTRHLYRVELLGSSFARDVGETVTLTHTRFGLTPGRNFLVLNVTENTDFEATELLLYG